MDKKDKDNLSDLATELDDKPNNDNSDKPQEDLAENQVVNPDGEVVNLNNPKENTVEK